MVSMTTDLNNRYLQVPQYASSYDFTAGNAPLMTVSGLRRTVEAITDSTKTLVAADSGKIFTLDRAAGITITLPAAAAGYFFDFIVTTTFTAQQQGPEGNGNAGIHTGGKFLANQWRECD